ncbi:MAG: DUF4147 domain-containing protein [Candidatus Promineifilaceae bacterium]|nr:DUF4147 domain-containing protein [Candidatus Promineifilaceae bacterium]
MTGRWSDFHQDIDALTQSALAAVDPAAAVRQQLRLENQHLYAGSGHYNLGAGRNYLVAVGKAAQPMAAAALESLAPFIHAGVVIAKADGSTEPIAMPSQIHSYLAGHPVPDAAGLEATEAVWQMLASTTPADAVLCLISGGTSALLTRPLIDLDHWQELIDALLASGCTITELNTVRQALDRIKGGGLARRAAPAACLSLILSDVVGNPLSYIGSGPTAQVQVDAHQVRTILKRYRIQEHLSAAAWTAISAALDHPSSAEPWPARLDHVVVGDVGRAARGAATAARQLGFATQVLTTHLEGEAREVGRVAAALAKDLPAGHCLILGGETTVTVRGDGRGGRNQELALAAALALEGQTRLVLASFATDGEDGPTPAAGALVTGETAAAIRASGLDPRAGLEDNDSYHCFQSLTAADSGGLIRTGPTGTNVNDLILILRYPPA